MKRRLLAYKIEKKYKKSLKGILIHLYTKQNYPARKCAKILNVGKTTILGWLHRFKIPLRDSTYPKTKEHIQKLTLTKKEWWAKNPNNNKLNFDEQVLLGSMLGDGHIRIHPNGKNPDFREEHSLKQRDYLLWKNSFLHFKIGYNKRFDKRFEGGNYISISLSSCSSPSLLEYYHLFYPNKTKVISKQILKILNLRGLAVWWCDDGSLCCYPTKKGFCYQGVLSTQKFTLKEHLLIQNWFKKLGLKTKIKENNKHQNFLTFANMDIKKLSDLIRPFIPKSMSYKLTNTYK